MADRTSSMSAKDKIGEAMRRSLPQLPDNAKATVLQMLQPWSLAIIAATLVAWVVSQFFGVGEIVDLILVVAGVFSLGFSVFSGARELYDFAKTAVNARTDHDLDIAADHFARAVVILGISVIQAVLMKGQVRNVIARGRPQIYPRGKMPAPPPAGNQLRVSRPATIPGGYLGGSDAYGVIEISREQVLTEQKLTLFHELVHRYFSPRTGPFRQLRAELRMTMYEHSAFLQYLEEALAEGYGQLKVHGLGKAIAAYRFPVQRGYVTVAQLKGEGQALGAIVLGGSLFYVSISHGKMPGSK